MQIPIKTYPLVPKPRIVRGLLDTSVIIDLENIERAKLPAEIAVSALTMAELAAGPHATNDLNERAARQDRLQRIEALVDPSPFDAFASLLMGRFGGQVLGQRKRKHHRAETADQ